MFDLTIPAPIRHDSPRWVRARHISSYLWAVWPILMNPPELSIHIRIPAHVKGFDHIDLKPVVEKALTGKRVRFVRTAVMAIRKGGEDICSRLDL